MSATKYYVSMTDNFLSGWECNDFEINKYVIECSSEKDAAIAYLNAKRRSEMSDIVFNTFNPWENNSDTLVSLVKFDELGECWTKFDAPRAVRTMSSLISWGT